MGQSNSSRVLRYGDETSSSLPSEMTKFVNARFGASGVVGVSCSHGALPTVIVATPRAVDIYNTLTGDRRLRLPSSSLVTAFDSRTDTLLGDIFAVGTAAGDVVLFSTDARELCNLHTNGVPVPEVDEFGTAVGEQAEEPAEQPSVTAVTLAGRNTVFVAHSDSSVRAFRLDSGELFKEYLPPTPAQLQRVTEEDAKVEDGDVKVDDDDAKIDEGVAAAPPPVATAVAVLTSGGDTVLVAVCLANCDVHFFDMTSCELRFKCTMPHPVSHVIAMNEIGCFALIASGSNAVGLWQQSTGLSIIDFRQENASTITAAEWDGTRARFMCAYSDGAIFIRSMTKDTSGIVKTTLQRVCKPRSTSTIVSLWYESTRDDLYTGGFTGVTRVVSQATGIPFDQTKEAATTARTERVEEASPTTATPAPSADATPVTVAPAAAVAPAPTTDAAPASNASASPAVAGSTEDGTASQDAAADDNAAAPAPTE